MIQRGINNAAGNHAEETKNHKGKLRVKPTRNRVLRVQFPVTFRAEILLPFILNINWMLELHHVFNGRGLHIARRALRNDGMT
jgi:hypothetical protein